MTQPLTDSTLVVANRFYDILDASKATLGIADVWFGDQTNVPRTPTLCVEPGVKQRELHSAQNMTLNNIDTFFLIYHSTLNTTQQVSRRDVVEFAEAIETFLHTNHLRLFSAGGEQLTIHGFCTDMDPGFAYKEKTLYNAVRMTWTSMSKTRLQP